uniref:ARAD1C01386p n=1 Tax=Blastobotrys adeninivorans TaxID=409370 RepID=A0A060SYZ9_BLAAD
MRCLRTGLHSTVAARCFARKCGSTFTSVRWKSTDSTPRPESKPVPQKHTNEPGSKHNETRPRLVHRHSRWAPKPGGKFGQPRSQEGPNHGATSNEKSEPTNERWNQKSHQQGPSQTMSAKGPEMSYQKPRRPAFGHSHNKYIRPSILLLSDRLVVQRKHPMGVIMAQESSKHGLNVPWFKLARSFYEHSKRNQRALGLYDRTQFEDPNFDFGKKYQAHMDETIANTFNKYRHLAKGDLNSANFARLCFQTSSRAMAPSSYFIPEIVQEFILSLNRFGIRWAIISNDGPHFETTLSELNRKLSPSRQLFVPGSGPMIINASKDGYYKPQARIFHRALRLTRNPDRALFVGINPVLDNVPESISLRSVLMTEQLKEPCSDITGKTRAEINRMARFRIKELKELGGYVFPDGAVQLSAPEPREERRKWGPKGPEPNQNSPTDLYSLLVPEAIGDSIVEDPFDPRVN